MHLPCQKFAGSITSVGATQPFALSHLAKPVAAVGSIMHPGEAAVRAAALAYAAVPSPQHSSNLVASVGLTSYPGLYAAGIQGAEAAELNPVPAKIHALVAS